MNTPSDDTSHVEPGDDSSAPNVEPGHGGGGSSKGNGSQGRSAVVTPVQLRPSLGHGEIHHQKHPGHRPNSIGKFHA